MTGLYDGVAGILNGVFGGAVTHIPPSGRPRILQAILRNPQIEVIGDSGHPVLDVSPVLRVGAAEAAGIAVGDTVISAAGRRYRIVNRQPSGSPAADTLVVFDLEVKG